MPDARITDVGDAVAAAALAAWNAAISPLTVAAPDEVERTYLVPVDFASLTGRKVYVTPVAFGDENADRGADLGAYDFALIVVERYTGTEERPPRAWLDERVWFVQVLFDVLKDYKPKKNPLTTAGGMKLYTESAAVEEVYAIEYLDKQHCFWAGLQFQFRGINP